MFTKPMWRFHRQRFHYGRWQLLPSMRTTHTFYPVVANAFTFTNKYIRTSCTSLLSSSSSLHWRLQTLWVPRRTIYNEPSYAFDMGQEVNSTSTPDLYSSKVEFNRKEMQRCFDGEDIDYKVKVRQEVRDIIEHLPNNVDANNRRNNYTASSCNSVNHNSNNAAIDSNARNTIHMLRVLCRRRVISYAEIISTPTHFASLYEVLATFDLPLALLTAEHFTFCTTLYTHFKVNVGYSKQHHQQHEEEEIQHNMARKSKKSTINHNCCSNSNSSNNDDSKHNNINSEEEECQLHKYQTELKETILESMEQGRSIGCCVRVNKNYCTRDRKQSVCARYDKLHHMYVLEGTTHLTIGASCADWALVEVFLIDDSDLDKNSKKQEKVKMMHTQGNDSVSRQTALFIVQLRDNGKVVPCISVHSAHNTTKLIRESAASHIVFRSYSIPASHMLCRERVKEGGKVARIAYQKYKTHYEEKEHEESGLQVLLTRSRVASVALYLGVLKKMINHLVVESAQHVIHGPEFMPDYPFMGLQYIQTPLCTLLSNITIFSLTWNVIVSKIVMQSSTLENNNNTSSSTTSSSSSCKIDERLKNSDRLSRTTRAQRDEEELEMEFTQEEKEVQLVGMLFELEQLLLTANNLAYTDLKLQPLLTLCNELEPLTLLSLRKENDDNTHTIREVIVNLAETCSLRSKMKWYLLTAFRSVPFLSLVLQKLFYSPRAWHISQHRLFFTKAYEELLCLLQNSRQRAKSDSDTRALWFDSVMLHHNHVLQCELLYMSVVCLNAIRVIQTRCKDDDTLSLIGKMLLLFSLTRQKDALPYLMTWRLLTWKDGLKIIKDVDLVANGLAMHAFNLVNVMQIPSSQLLHTSSMHHEQEYHFNNNTDSTDSSNENEASCYDSDNVNYDNAENCKEDGSPVDELNSTNNKRNNVRETDDQHEMNRGAYTYKENNTNVQCDSTVEFDYLHGLDERVTHK